MGRVRIETFAVSFVISYQNRWTSFRDPNRWLIRFEEDFHTLPPPRGIDTDYHNRYFPDYWHPTDYMQHRLIGPLILQIYESDRLKPGTYAVTPRVTHWEAPGPILARKNHRMESGLPVFRKHVEGTETPLLVKRSSSVDEGYYRDGKRYIVGGTTPDGAILMDGIFHFHAVPTSPNPNYPLPGHVLTNAATQPGTDIWRKYQMDDYDHEW